MAFSDEHKKGCPVCDEPDDSFDYVGPGENVNWAQAFQNVAIVVVIALGILALCFWS